MPHLKHDASAASDDDAIAANGATDNNATAITLRIRTVMCRSSFMLIADQALICLTFWLRTSDMRHGQLGTHQPPTEGALAAWSGTVSHRG